MSDSVLKLSPWQEVIGELKKIDRKAGMLRIVLNFGVLEFKEDSKVAQILEEKLEECEKCKISVLRTDIPDNPLLVHVEGSQVRDLAEKDEEAGGVEKVEQASV